MIPHHYQAMSDTFSAPPPPPKPEEPISRIQRVYNAERLAQIDQDCADSHDSLDELLQEVWRQEAWAREEDHIDQQVENRARIDAALERRKRRAE